MVLVSCKHPTPVYLDGEINGVLFLTCFSNTIVEDGFNYLVSVHNIIQEYLQQHSWLIAFTMLDLTHETQFLLLDHLQYLGMITSVVRFSDDLRQIFITLIRKWHLVNGCDIIFHFSFVTGPWLALAGFNRSLQWLCWNRQLLSKCVHSWRASKQEFLNFN